jgi:predicted RNase H-like HicB family nuclease
MPYRYPSVHSAILEAAVELAITTERAGDKGWIAFAAEVRATAQGATKAEAKKNLRALLGRYPDLLDELRQAADRRVELIRI